MAPHNLQLQLVGCPDNPNGLPMYVTTPVSPYVADAEWNIASGHPWGFDFCLGHFARFACLYLFHLSHPRIRVGGFRQLKTARKPNFLKPVKGTLTRQSLMGLRVAAMPAADPLVIASVGDAPDASPPCGMEAKMEVEGLLEVSIASVRGRQEQLELRPFTPSIPQPNQKPRNASGAAWKDIHYGSTDYRAKRVRNKFGRTPNVDGFNAYPDMAQTLSYISPDKDCFKTELNPALLYWLYLAFEMFGAMIERVCATGMQAIVIAPEWDEQQWWGPLMSITKEACILPLPSSGAEIYEDKRLVPLPQREWATVAIFVDGQLSHHAEFDDSPISRDMSVRIHGDSAPFPVFGLDAQCAALVLRPIEDREKHLPAHHQMHLSRRKGKLLVRSVVSTQGEFTWPHACSLRERIFRDYEKDIVSGDVRLPPRGEVPDRFPGGVAELTPTTVLAQKLNDL